MTWIGIVAAVLILISCWKGYKNGFIREITAMFFVILSIALVWVINPYVNSFLKENTPICQITEENCKRILEEKQNNSLVEQHNEKSVIENLSLPEILENEILKNNTQETYVSLAVSGFEEYVMKYIGTVVVNGLSFLISYLLATICIRTISYALNIITSLPIINGVNKIAGLFIGGARGVIIIWLVLLLILIMCNMELGRKGMELVERDVLLNTLNQYNPFVYIFTNIFYGIN